MSSPEVARASPVAIARAKSLNRWLLAGHLVLAAFVMLRGYPATQDGPAHLYGTHVLRALARDPGSPYGEFFAANLRPGGNSLFFYMARGSDGWISVEAMASIALFLAVAGLPLSAIALAAALHAQVRQGERGALPLVAATSLACPLAYNYFIYRGFFNYTLSVPLAIGCLAAVIAVAPAQGLLARAGLAVTAATLGALASLAHPSALVFLLAAISMASLRGASARRWVAGLVIVLLLGFAWMSRVVADSAPPAEWSSPQSSVMRYVRALGVTHGWIEVVPASALLLLLGWGAVRALRPIRGLFDRWERAWPAALAAAMTAGFFVVPFEYGGTAGLNERIPLFAGMLVMPYVPMAGRLMRWLPLGLVGFALYTGIGSVIRERRIDEVRSAAAATALPRGALLYPVTLDMKLGSLSCDLGRSLLSDVARRRDAMGGVTFCGHPGHPVRCTSPRLATHDSWPAERFADLSSDEQRRALADPASPIREMLRHIVHFARGADYLAVLPWPPLDAAFQEHVVRELGAEGVGATDGPLGLYRVPQPSGGD